MISPVSSAKISQPSAQVSSPAPTSSQTSTQSTLPKDTVQISNAAQLAIKETIETPAQTATEASRGDAQARRLLAREAADKSLVAAVKSGGVRS